ncbi:hypothetical protein J23TS9_44750 [Paenibacillus sp. J23TS9]|nr:hypothetical protein J23TS9_44750 [Paenibacillus sp. J23TS9]
MDINLIPVTQTERKLLSNLYQLYHYDFSEYTDQDIQSDGKYEGDID